MFACGFPTRSEMTKQPCWQSSKQISAEAGTGMAVTVGRGSLWVATYFESIIPNSMDFRTFFTSVNAEECHEQLYLSFKTFTGRE